MKKFLFVILTSLILLGLAGCEFPREQAILIGTVTEVYDTSILIEADIGPCVVTLPDGDSDFSPGDTVEILFSGEIATSYPMQIHHVYRIRRVDPPES